MVPTANVLNIEKFSEGGPRIAIVPAEHNGRMQPHSHDFYEIVYVEDGFTLHSAGGIINILVTGDLFFVKPGENHSYINAYQTKLYNLIFSADELGSLLPELKQLPGLDEMLSDTTSDVTGIRILHVDMGERRNLEQSLENIRTERLEKRTGWQCSLKNRLASFLIRYSRMFEEQRDKRTQSDDDYYGYVYKILRYVDDHYGENITMNDLSDVTGLSPDYMTRKFKAALYMTPSEYVRKFRISRAMELLCTTELSVADVAKRTGFSDISLFSRVFKQEVGLPPASYRKNALTGGK